MIDPWPKARHAKKRRLPRHLRAGLSALLLLAASLVVVSRLGAEATESLALDHIACLESRDLDCLMAGYSDQATLVVDAGRLEGTAAIREVLEILLRRTRRTRRNSRDRNRGVRGRTSPFELGRRDRRACLRLRGSTIVPSDGKIGLQTFFARVTPKIDGVAPHVETENLGSYPRNLVDFAGTALFFATDNEHGAALWRSDGTAEGTRIHQRHHPGPHQRRAGGLDRVQGTPLFFRVPELLLRLRWPLRAPLRPLAHRRNRRRNPSSQGTEDELRGEHGCCPRRRVLLRRR